MREQLEMLTKLLDSDTSLSGSWVFQKALGLQIFNSFLDPSKNQEFAHAIRETTSIDMKLSNTGPMVELYLRYIDEIIETCVVEIFSKFYEGQQIELLNAKSDDESFTSLWYEMAKSDSIINLVNNKISKFPVQNSIRVVPYADCLFPFSIQIFQWMEKQAFEISKHRGTMDPNKVAEQFAEVFKTLDVRNTLAIITPEWENSFCKDFCRFVLGDIRPSKMSDSTFLAWADILNMLMEVPPFEAVDELQDSFDVCADPAEQEESGKPSLPEWFLELEEGAQIAIKEAIHAAKEEYKELDDWHYEVLVKDLEEHLDEDDEEEKMILIKEFAYYVPLENDSPRPVELEDEKAPLEDNPKMFESKVEENVDVTNCFVLRLWETWYKNKRNLLDAVSLITDEETIYSIARVNFEVPSINERIKSLSKRVARALIREVSEMKKIRGLENIVQRLRRFAQRTNDNELQNMADLLFLQASAQASADWENGKEEDNVCRSLHNAFADQMDEKGTVVGGDGFRKLVSALAISKDDVIVHAKINVMMMFFDLTKSLKGYDVVNFTRSLQFEMKNSFWDWPARLQNKASYTLMNMATNENLREYREQLIASIDDVLSHETSVKENFLDGTLSRAIVAAFEDKYTKPITLPEDTNIPRGYRGLEALARIKAAFKTIAKLCHDKKHTLDLSCLEPFIAPTKEHEFGDGVSRSLKVMFIRLLLRYCTDKEAVAVLRDLRKRSPHLFEGHDNLFFLVDLKDIDVDPLVIIKGYSESRQSLLQCVSEKDDLKENELKRYDPLALNLGVYFDERLRKQLFEGECVTKVLNDEASIGFLDNISRKLPKWDLGFRNNFRTLDVKRFFVHMALICCEMPSNFVKDLIVDPLSLKEKYIPSMPEDMTAKLFAAVDAVEGRKMWRFECENGHAYLVGECGYHHAGVTSLSKCPEPCGATIGPADRSKEERWKGHTRENRDKQSAKGYALSNQDGERAVTTSIIILRCFLHAALIVHHFTHPNSEVGIMIKNTEIKGKKQKQRYRSMGKYLINMFKLDLRKLSQDLETNEGNSLLWLHIALEHFRVSYSEKYEKGVNLMLEENKLSFEEWFGKLISGLVNTEKDRENVSKMLQKVRDAQETKEPFFLIRDEIEERKNLLSEEGKRYRTDFYPGLFTRMPLVTIDVFFECFSKLNEKEQKKYPIISILLKRDKMLFNIRLIPEMMKFVQYIYNKCQRRFKEQDLRKKTFENFLKEHNATHVVWKQFSAFLQIWNNLAGRETIGYECQTIKLDTLKRKASLLFAVASNTTEGQLFKIVLTILTNYQNEIMKEICDEERQEQERYLDMVRIDDMICLKEDFVEDIFLSFDEATAVKGKTRPPKWLGQPENKFVRDMLIEIWKQYKDVEILRQQFPQLDEKNLVEAVNYFMVTYGGPDEDEKGEGDKNEFIYSSVPNLLEIISVTSTRVTGYATQAKVSFDFDAVENTLRKHMFNDCKKLVPRIMGFEFIGTTSMEELCRRLEKCGLKPEVADDAIIQEITRGLSAQELENLLRLLEEATHFAAKWPQKNGLVLGKLKFWTFCKDSLKMGENEWGLLKIDGAEKQLELCHAKDAWLKLNRMVFFAHDSNLKVPGDIPGVYFEDTDKKLDGQLKLLKMNFKVLQIIEQETLLFELHDSMKKMSGTTTDKVSVRMLDEFLRYIVCIDENIADRMNCGFETRFLAKGFEALVEVWKESQ